MIGKVAAVVAAVVLVAFAGIALPFFAVIGAIGYVIDALVGFGESVGNVIIGVLDWFASLPGRIGAFLSGLPAMLYEVGSNIIGGLVDGITAKGAAIVSALLGPVRSGISAVKSALGIASPSKVFAGIGDNVVAGFAGSVEEGSDVAQSALETMVEPVSPPALDVLPGASGGKGAAARGGDRSVTITGPFYFYGVEGAEDAETRFEGLLTRVLEGDVASLGAELGELEPA
jgi:hypothetical protein